MVSFHGAAPPTSPGSDAALQQQQQQQQLARARALQEELERRVRAAHGAAAPTAAHGDNLAGGVPALLAAVEAGLRLREQKRGGSADRLVVASHVC